jgi:hypothetical protein
VRGSSSRRVIIDITPRRVIIECDVSHLNPRLGKIVQEFHLAEDDAFGAVTNKQLFVSAFRLYAKDATRHSNFYALLDRQTKDRIWDEVFALKQAYFLLEAPDVVEHIIKYPLDFQRRYALYKERLLLPDYDITADPGARTIWIERREAWFPGADEVL